ncbi:hypothetical protein Cni_G24757 [Canna indica]|uniref:3'-5' exonuclease domain-containing protein n=1 Tax=Canna indica TaxID=4628 RepID=A0AAQ3QPV4_9LILI|nr:hypothetical protein Cni_G24757 [Canna indica]
MFVRILQYDPSFYSVVINETDDVLTTVTASGAKVDWWLNVVLNTHSDRLHELVVGLDCEWFPCVGPNRNPTAVLQICVGRRCLIFQLLYADYTPPSLIHFLQDARFTFYGAGINGDAQRLQEDKGLVLSNTVDLRDFAAERMGRPELRNVGLARLAEVVMHIRMDKPRWVTLSNWDQRYLSHPQISYACADAFISFEIGRRLRINRF